MQSGCHKKPARESVQHQNSLGRRPRETSGLLSWLQDRLAYLLAYGNKPEKKGCGISRRARLQGLPLPHRMHNQDDLDIGDLSSSDSDSEEALTNR